MVSARRSTSNKPSKKVHFNEDVQINVIEDTFTLEEKQATWYSQSDLKKIRKNRSSSCCYICTLPVVQEKTKNACLSVSDCTCKVDERRKQHEFIANFLLQQEENKSMGVEDPKGLFQLSRACSKKSRQRALQFGRDHAKEVKSFEAIRQETLRIIDDVLELVLGGDDDIDGPLL